jgi:hypothetical protein
MARDEGQGSIGGARVPFLFVPHGTARPADWLAAHPGAVKIPASLVPRGPARRGDSLRRTRSGASWPNAADGRPWPRDRFGNLYRPLSDYGPGERAPGDPVARAAWRRSLGGRPDLDRPN